MTAKTASNVWLVFIGFAFMIAAALVIEDCANGESRLTTCEQAIIYCAQHRGARCSRVPELYPRLRQ